jgi:hypothetical protein
MVEREAPLSIKWCLNVSYDFAKWRWGLGQGSVSGSLSTPQSSKLQVQERIQLLQRVIFCLQSSYCVCNWIRIRRSKGWGLGVRFLDLDSDEARLEGSGWRKGGGRDEDTGSRVPGGPESREMLLVVCGYPKPCFPIEPGTPQLEGISRLGISFMFLCWDEQVTPL